MMKLYIGLFALIILFGFSRNHANGQVNNPLKNTVTIVMGVGQGGDTTLGCCNGGICVTGAVPSIYTGGKLADSEVVMELSLSGNILTGEFKTTNPDKSNNFMVRKEFSFSPAISKKLRCTSIIIKAKSYIIDFSKNRLGTLKLDVRTVPIVDQIQK